MRIRELLERINHLLRAEERHSGGGLQFVHLQILDYLGRCNRYSDTPAAVADYLGLTRGTVSQSLIRLESRGLIVKITDLRDGRRVHLHLTPSGRKVADSARREQLLDRALRSLPPEFAPHLEHSLTRLLVELQRCHGGVAFGVCRTCRHFQTDPGGAGHRCGLTGEALSEPDSHLLCREHQPAAAGGPV
ncbi:MAG: MarR family transcriptional regulator [Acidobacteriota bacterium]